MRTVHPVVPPRVDYALTPMGETLLATVRQLIEWADEPADEFDTARARYDARPAGEYTLTVEASPAVAEAR